MNTPGSLKHFMIHSDPEFFHKIFISLLTKALMETEKGCIEFGYILAGKDKFHFFVKDGAGYLPFEQYEPFESMIAGPDFEGLPGTLTMIDTLGGKIWVESLPGRGKTWWFTFDVLPKTSGMNTIMNTFEPDQKPDWSGKTILVVEDIYNNVLLLEGILAPTGLTLISVENGMKAINVVKKNNEIDLVLMDLRLPVLDGYEASRRIKSHSPGLPIVAISAYAIGEEIDRCIRAGCDRFLSKPLNASELIRTISELFQ